ncbi:deoxyribodipyrimidine photo-lyase/cryptochrome family protein [Motilimonas sp. KMU-193]|uniref:cryptochrome/deoxyribodipyrimidine photo-lyase family protein n=1 Tax=Motilimonas sp. KMU-193 TaxID=3388668 RepID=UPI00396B305B
MQDHEPLFEAARSGGRVLLIYCFEPMQLTDEHYRLRHWRFVLQSLQDMAVRLPNKSILCSQASALETFTQLHRLTPLTAIFSHQEVGLENTFRRDQAMAAWFKRNNISWHETPYAAVMRGLNHRSDWQNNWHKVMRAEQKNCDLAKVDWHILSDQQLTQLGLMPPSSMHITQLDEKVSQVTPYQHRYDDLQGHFQQGGESFAQQTLSSFFTERGKPYYYSLSSPNTSQAHCSRLSAYLAWGNLSLRQVYQMTLAHWQQPGWRKSLIAFSARLHWHCHFIQKFESQHEIEFMPMNSGYQAMPSTTGELAIKRLKAWQQGQTGIPMVDACMRCLLATGYINFRMRAMLVSFLCHHLDLDWRLGVKHLASVFLDFEPGIHYRQFQMQAGITGINTIRIYNPVKQGIEQDPEGEFVRRWCPELAQLPNEVVHSPWQMAPMEQLFYQVELGMDYPFPLVDIKQSYQFAQAKLWHWRDRPQVKRQVAHILARHVQPKANKTKPKPRN